MGKMDKRVDAYIAKSAEFAQPILNHIRALIHKTCPEVVEEIKWNFPVFEYHGVLCNMAGFKEHCAFGFWKASLMKDPEKIFGSTAMGDLDKIRSMKDLPKDSVLIKYIQEAMKLNEEGTKVPRRAPTKDKTLDIPDYFTKAISKNRKALKVFEGFSYTNKKEYVEWVTEAKTDDTRNKRLDTAVEWIAEGKVRNWKHIKK